MIAGGPVANGQDSAVVRTTDSAPKTKSRVLGSLFGVFLFFFAGLHAFAGMAATSHTDNRFVIWAATGSWLVSAGALSLAAYGLWGFPGLAFRWRSLATIGAFTSIGMLMATGQWQMWPLMLLDGVIVSIAIDSDPLMLPRKNRGIVKLTLLGLVQLLAIAFWLYAAASVALRPWMDTWGATDAEIARLLPGDAGKPLEGAANHVVTVNASPEKVWPWLIQLGQDKAGFYSYDFLERGVGAKIYNKFEIRPEWQNLKKGDFIKAVQDDWLGGRFKGEAGWRVTDLAKDRYLVLENWGTFWLEPTADGKTRFGVRTSGGQPPFWAAPLIVFGMGPAHFIMEQKMLLTIKELAERS